MSVSLPAKVVFVGILTFTAIVASAQKSQEKLFVPSSAVSAKDFESLGLKADQNLGLKVFVQNAGLKLGDSPSIRNTLYASANLKKWIFVQANMAVADKAEGDITSLVDGKSFFSVQGKTNFFILTKGLEREELFRLRKQILKNTGSKSATSAANWEFITPRWIWADVLLRTQASYASSKCLSSQEIQQQLKATGEQDFKMGECLNKGAWNATGGVVETVYEVLTKGSEQILCGAASVVNATWSRCGEYAVAMQRTVDSTMNAVGNIKQVAGEFVDGFASLPGSVQAQIVCEMASTAGSGAAVSFMTSGAGAPAAWVRMSEVLNKVSDMPGMSKNSDTLKAMAAKVELKGKEKAASIANAKVIPADLKESLVKIKSDQKEFIANSERLEAASRKLELKLQEVDNNPSRYAAENMLVHAEKRLEKVFRNEISSDIEDKQLATFLLKFAKLSDAEKTLATNVIKTASVGIAKHDGDADIVKLAKAMRNKRISNRLEIRDDIEYATPEQFAKVATEQGALSYERTQALKAYSKSREKVSGDITHYWDLIEKKNLTVQEKEFHRSQVSAYMTVVICNGAGGATDGVLMRENNGVQ